MIHLYLVGPTVTALGLIAIVSTWIIIKHPTTLRHIPRRYKTKLETRLYDNAREHEYNERWTKAQRTYHLLTILQPSDPHFWRHKTIAHLENQDPHQALETLHEAHQTIPMPNPDLIELETLTHKDLGDPQQAQHALRRLAKLDPKQAQHFILDLQLHHLADDPDIQQAIGPNPGGGGIDGYA